MFSATLPYSITQVTGIQLTKLAKLGNMGKKKYFRSSNKNNISMVILHSMIRVVYIRQAQFSYYYKPLYQPIKQSVSNKHNLIVHSYLIFQ